MNGMQSTTTLPGRFLSYLDLNIGSNEWELCSAIVPTPSDLWCPQFTCYWLLVCSDLFPFAYCPLVLCFYVQQVRDAVTVFPASRLAACAVRLVVHSAAARAVDLRPRGSAFLPVTAALDALHPRAYSVVTLRWPPASLTAVCALFIA